MRRRAALVVGALVAAGYLAVAVVTARVEGHRVLPLYEGVGNAPAYQWVNPPAVFKTANVPPKASTQRIALGKSGSSVGGISSQDTQFIVTLSAGAIPPHAGSTTATAQIDPIDPATLSPLPGGVRPNGNAYRITVAYDPSGPAITTFSAKASEVLSVPLPANRGLFYSSDGRSWTRVAGPPPATETNTVSAQSDRTGIFLAGTTHRATAGAGTSSTPIATVIAGVLIGIALVGGGAWFLLRLLSPTPAARTQSATKRKPQNRKR